MSDMVERVAAAIERANDSAPSFGMKVSDIIKLMARAAIEAMREPTERMALAGDGVGRYQHCDGEDGNWHEWYEHDPEEVWQAMIDEALKSNTQYR